ncbi:hypothetical protein HPB52_002710 [Rhipicephalus sanguineus]|uniref:Uncharacterized protein n=1 Tax=Rhipicephalus sanguineus TaxID=34632 RepID=A0A9D4PJ02_RHISA|nr:hypothetical protein HPB52_002710 [Rhipicephalus sanguineus]
MDSATYYGPGGVVVDDASWSSASPEPSYSVTRQNALFRGEPREMFGCLFGLDTDGGLCLKEKDVHGAYLLDRCPMYVEPILEYLQNGRLLLNDKVSYPGQLTVMMATLTLMIMLMMMAMRGPSLTDAIMDGSVLYGVNFRYAKLYQRQPAELRPPARCSLATQT